MKTLKASHIAVSTVLAFALIPLSGFATDVYIPSFPAMAQFFGTSRGDIQLSLVVFVISTGIAQLFVGSLLDSFGRYRLTLVALLVFGLSSFLIATTGSLTILLILRVIQGMSVALIVVSKRAFFMDVYSGAKLKHYTSLFSIIWATAPIAAPFLGGFLQHYFGWESNFYFLGLATVAILILELIYSGETLKVAQPLKLDSLVNTYRSILSTPDYTISLVILGLCFANILLFNMASPFIIEHVFHKSSVTTGNAALLSGVAVMTGGLISKSQINRSITKKILLAGPLFFGLAALTIIIMGFFPTLPVMVTMVMLLHIVSGFTFNTFYTHALSRFSSNAGIVSGITGGGTFIITSLFSYAVVNALNIQTPMMLGIGYLIIAIFFGVSLALFAQAHYKRTTAALASAA